MKICKAFKEHKYLWQMFALLTIMGINTRHALAVIPHEIGVACPGTPVPPAPTNLLRMQGDSEVWSFVIKPEPGVFITNQVWTYKGKNGEDPDWGIFTGGDGTNGLNWSSDNEAGDFTIDVKAKRHCAGGGQGDDNFELTWKGTVATFEYHAERQTGYLAGYLQSVGTFAPVDKSKNQDGIRVSKGQRLTLRDSWIDTDFRGPTGSPETSWEAVNGTGTYTITASTNGVGITFVQGQLVQSHDYAVDKAEGGIGNIDPGNIYAYVTDTWDGQPFDITLSITDSGKVPIGSLGNPKDTDKTDPAQLTKHFVKAQYVPKSLELLPDPPSTGVEGENIISADSNVVFWYQGEPGSPPGTDDPGSGATRPFYDGEAVDEKFGTFSPTFTLDDLTDAWKIEFSPNTVQDAFRILFLPDLINTSFTLHQDSGYDDVFQDPHKFVPDSDQLAAFTPAALASNVIGFDVNQTYTSGSYSIGNFHLKLTYDNATQKQTIDKN